MSEPLSGFEWDKGNLEHCRKHGVSRPEIEGVFASRVIILPDDDHSGTEKRFRAIGRTKNGRPVFVVFTIRERHGRHYIRPVSARYMHRAEIETYEKENPDF
jgi:uncharacterized DUF497 family protein